MKKLVFLIILLLVGLLAFGMYRMNLVSSLPDMQCQVAHKTNLIKPVVVETAFDYFINGNYEYESGNCQNAVSDYSKSIILDTQLPEVYNNRAYTYMRMHDYKRAFNDLNMALLLRPNYINALMNQGDLFNFYGPIINREKAIKNYDKVIAMGGASNSSVCGHRAMAQSNNYLIGAFIRLFTGPKCI